MPLQSIDIRELATMPIPQLASVDGWKEKPITPSNEPLVAVSEIGIASASFYAGIHDFSPYNRDALPGALHDVYVRQGVGEAMLRAQNLLPPDYALIALDGQRPSTVQRSLFDFFTRQLAEAQPTWSTEARELYTQKYVSKPSTDTMRPAPHATGGSIDHWLVQLPRGHDRREANTTEILQSGNWLSAGVPFDHGGERSAVRYYEEHDDSAEAIIFRAHRRVFYWIMREAGFEAYPDEFWHSNLGNQMAAQTAGQSAAIYGIAELSDAQVAREQVLRTRTRGTKIATNLPMGEIIRPEF